MEYLCSGLVLQIQHDLPPPASSVDQAELRSNMANLFFSRAAHNHIRRDESGPRPALILGLSNSCPLSGDFGCGEINQNHGKLLTYQVQRLDLTLTLQRTGSISMIGYSSLQQDFMKFMSSQILHL